MYVCVIGSLLGGVVMVHVEHGRHIAPGTDTELCWAPGVCKVADVIDLHTQAMVKACKHG